MPEVKRENMVKAKSVGQQGRARRPPVRKKRVEHARRFLTKLQEAESFVRSQNSHSQNLRLDDLQLTKLVRREKDKLYASIVDSAQSFIEGSSHPVAHLHRFLIDRAEQYYFDMERSFSRQNSRAVLQQINRHAVSLSGIIEENTFAWERLWHIAFRDEHWNKADRPTWFLLGTTDDDPGLHRCIDSPLEIASHAIQRLAAWSDEALKVRKRGRTPDQELHDFVFALVQFWRLYLERPVKPRAIKRGTLHEFASTLVKCVDPYLSEKSVSNALRSRSVLAGIPTN